MAVSDRGAPQPPSLWQGRGGEAPVIPLFRSSQWACFLPAPASQPADCRSEPLQNQRRFGGPQSAPGPARFGDAILLRAEI